MTQYIPAEQIEALIQEWQNRAKKALSYCHKEASYTWEECAIELCDMLTAQAETKADPPAIAQELATEQVVDKELPDRAGPCPRCEGEGKIHDADFSDGDSDQQMRLMQDTIRDCPDCSGTGSVIRLKASIKLLFLANDIERVITALREKLAAAESERDELRADVARLVLRFRHTFITPDSTEDDPHRERCQHCGFNIRSDLHLRATSTAPEPNCE